MTKLLLVWMALGQPAGERCPQVPICNSLHESTEIVKGVRYYNCRDNSPAVHVVTIDQTLAAEKYELSLLQQPTACTAGRPCPVPPETLEMLHLRTLKQLATDSGAVVALNGSPWKDDLGWSDYAYGTPSTTTFKDGVQQTGNTSLDNDVCNHTYDPANCYYKEAWMGFSDSSSGVIGAERMEIDQPQPLPPQQLRHALYGSNSSIVEHDKCTDWKESHVFSVVGYGGGKITLLITDDWVQALDLCPILRCGFNVREAVAQDGDTAAEMYVQSPGPGEIPSARFQRRIAYGLGLVPRPPAVDIAFVFDLTGSMWDDIDRVKAESEAIITATSLLTGNYRVAVAAYKDHPVDPYGEPGDYPYRPVLPFTSDKNAFVQAVRSLEVGGGGDLPEAECSALKGTLNVQGLGMGWREDAVKAIVLITDANGRSPEPVSGCLWSEVYDVANRPPIVRMPMRKGARAAAATAATSPVAIHPILIGSDPDAEAQLAELAKRTGGTLFHAAGADDIVAAILKAIRAAPANRPPVCTGAVASAPMLWPPNHSMLDVQVRGVVDPDGDPVLVQVTDIKQDEPIKLRGKKPEPDGVISGPGRVKLRAERNGPDNGRVYQISFDAVDGKGGSCSGSVLSCVPHDQRPNASCVNDGARYSSRRP